MGKVTSVLPNHSTPNPKQASLWYGSIDRGNTELEVRYDGIWSKLDSKGAGHKMSTLMRGFAHGLAG